MTATGGGDRDVVTSQDCGFGGVGDGVLAPPNLRLGSKLRLQRERAAQFAVVSVELKARADRGRSGTARTREPSCQEFAGCRAAPHNDERSPRSPLGLAGYIEHVSGRRAQFERAALVIVKVVANPTEYFHRVATHPWDFHEQPGRGWHHLNGSPDGLADGLHEDIARVAAAALMDPARHAGEKSSIDH